MTRRWASRSSIQKILPENCKARLTYAKAGSIMRKLMYFWPMRPASGPMQWTQSWQSRHSAPPPSPNKAPHLPHWRHPISSTSRTAAAFGMVRFIMLIIRRWGWLWWWERLRGLWGRLSLDSGGGLAKKRFINLPRLLSSHFVESVKINNHWFANILNQNTFRAS